MQKSRPSDRTSNHLLATLNRVEFDKMDPAFERILLTSGDALIKPNAMMRDVWFPEEGMISLVQPMADGSMIEVGLVGKEGMVGTPLILGANRWPVEAMVQMPGSALRMSADRLLEEIGRNAPFRKLLHRYVQALFVQVTQSAACNSRHTLSQRLARWLLMAHDRADGDELKLSHEFIAMMLGIRRAGVTVALAGFKASGILSNSHGRVTLLNRSGLEAVACECYRSVKTETERLFRS